MEYQSTLDITHRRMPRGKLVTVSADDNGAITLLWKAGHIHPAAARGVRALSDGISAASLLTFDPNLLGQDPSEGIVAWFLRLPPEEMPTPGQVVACEVGRHEGLPPFFEVRIREDFIDPELVRQVNEEALPWLCAGLVPVRV